MQFEQLANDIPFAEDRAAIMKALGHPVRLRLVAYLAGSEEETVTGLCQNLGLPQAKVSQQLAFLRLHHLVNVRKQNGFHFYSLAIPAMVDLLACLTRNCRTETFAS